MVTDSGWETSLSDPVPTSEAPWPGPVFEYSRLGDAVVVGVRLQNASYDLQALIDNYRTHQNGNGLTYDDVVTTYQAALAANRSSLARMLADVSQHVTLRQEELEVGLEVGLPEPPRKLARAMT